MATLWLEKIILAANCLNIVCKAQMACTIIILRDYIRQVSREGKSVRA